MKILHQDLKKGEIKVKVEGEEDCWHLYNIVEEGDYIEGFTYRSKENTGDKIRSKKVEKERVYLKIKVTDKEFHEFTNVLRIRGIIVEGIEETGAYHTFNIQPNMEIKIIKEEWKDIHLKRLKESLKIQPKIAILSMDDEYATIAIVHEYGLQELATIFSHKSGKMYESKYDEKGYYGEILSKIKNINVPIAIVGPGFDKNNFVEFAKGQLKNYVVENTAHAGMPGAYEAIKRGVIEKINKENRVAKEIKIMEKFFEEISKDGNAIYGIEEIKNALDMGAIEKLIVLDSMVREYEDIIKKTEQMGGDVVIISHFHEGGAKLQALGGLAALLRYKLR